MRYPPIYTFHIATEPASRCFINKKYYQNKEYVIHISELV